MSGFLMMYGYGSKELSPSIKYNGDFSIKRIRKLYPLHIITMILAIAFNLVVIMHSGITLKRFVHYLVK